MKTFLKYPVMTILYILFIGISTALGAFMLFAAVPELISGDLGDPKEPFYALGITVAIFLSPFLLVSASGAVFIRHLLKKYTENEIDTKEKTP